MFDPSYFKTPINRNHDTHKSSVYEVDSFISDVLKGNLAHLDVNSMSELIMQNEGLDFIRIEENNKERTSSCSFFRRLIDFSPNHINKPIVAIHEFAHFIDDLFSAIDLPSHHIGFLSAYDYLINKTLFKGKKINLVETAVDSFNDFSGCRNIPYIRDYYQVKDISEEEYNNLLKSLPNKMTPLNNNSFSLTYGEKRDYTKTGFDLNDHYINLIHLHSGNRYIKVIVKKLGFEIKKKEMKEYDFIISPTFMFTYCNSKPTRTTSQHHACYNGIILHEINKDKIDRLVKIITNSNTLKGAQFYFEIEYMNQDSVGIFIDYDAFYRNEINTIFSKIKKEIKKEGFSFYQSKSKADLDHQLKDNDHWFIY